MMSNETRLAMAKAGNPEDLDVLVNDKSVAVRIAVLEHGRPNDLFALRRDKNYSVRLAVLKHKRLNDAKKMRKDKEFYIRYVADKIIENPEVDLNTLIPYMSFENRKILAENNHELIVLMKDPDWKIRQAVAKYGMLEIVKPLINDKHRWVSEIIKNRIIESIRSNAV